MSKILYVNGCKVETKWEKLKRKTSEKAKSAMQWRQAARRFSANG